MSEQLEKPSANKWSLRQMHLFSALSAIQASKGIGWRREGEFPNALLTWVQYRADAWGFNDFLKTMRRENKSISEICQVFRIDPSAAQWLLTKNEALPPDLGYTDQSRREILIAQLKAFLDAWDTGDEPTTPDPRR